MKKMMYVLGLSAVLVLALLSGCAEKETREENTHAASQKQVISFEGVVTAAEDDTDLDVITENRIWTNTAPAGEKIVVNFEGRVSAVENEKVVLEDGKIIIINSETVITAPDGSFSEAAVGDYIQGYAKDPTGNEIYVDYILITAL